jgi:hypothetical protein
MRCLFRFAARDDEANRQAKACHNRSSSDRAQDRSVLECEAIRSSISFSTA